jgi:hypothetical protein
LDNQEKLRKNRAEAPLPWYSAAAGRMPTSPYNGIVSFLKPQSKPFARKDCSCGGNGVQLSSHNRYPLVAICFRHVIGASHNAADRQ